MASTSTFFFLLLILLLQMVRTLNDNGANSIWEHTLLDPSNSKFSRRKPTPKDPLQSVAMLIK